MGISNSTAIRRTTNAIWVGTLFLPVMFVFASWQLAQIHRDLVALRGEHAKVCEIQASDVDGDADPERPTSEPVVNKRLTNLSQDRSLEFPAARKRINEQHLIAPKPIPEPSPSTHVGGPL